MPRSNNGCPESIASIETDARSSVLDPSREIMECVIGAQLTSKTDASNGTARRGTLKCNERSSPRECTDMVTNWPVQLLTPKRACMVHEPNKDYTVCIKLQWQIVS